MWGTSITWQVGETITPGFEALRRLPPPKLALRARDDVAELTAEPHLPPD
jgi:hypothetical protein